MSASEDSSRRYSSRWFRPLDAPAVEIQTYAGAAGINPQPFRLVTDGVGTHARFIAARHISIALDGATAVVVEDTVDTLRLIRYFEGNATVTTLAGQSARASGVEPSGCYDDGVGTSVMLHNLRDAAISGDGREAYLAQGTAPNLVRKIDIESGQITTVAGRQNAGWASVSPCSGSSKLEGVDATGTNALFCDLRAITVNHDASKAFVIDGTTIRQITLPSGSVTALVGRPTGQVTAEEPLNYADGIGTNVDFVRGINQYLTSNADGSSLYFTDGHRLRKLEVGTRAVTTIAGTFTSSMTAKSPLDGVGTTGDFFASPKGLAVVNGGSILLVADSLNYRVAQVDVASGRVSTLAGCDRGLAVGLDGPPGGGTFGVASDVAAM